jgi:class 3 adenylate cyclase
MKSHAVVMARFAFECLNKTSEITAQLTSTLGMGTSDLRLRIGLNSGPTTAGGKSHYCCTWLL